MDRAYSLLTIRNINDGERVIEGIASTPEPDRMGDIVEPLGAKFKTPLPLLWQHRHSEPIGNVEFAKPTKTGIPFRARIAKCDEPGTLKDRLDEAWQSLKLGLVRAVSIGFRAIEYARLENGGLRFIEWEWLELSCVTIPAQADATITAVKSIDRRLLAASGREAGVRIEERPGVSGKSNPSGQGNNPMKPINEQIAELEAQRKGLATQMQAFGDVTDLDADQAKSYDEVSGQFEQTEAPYKRLKALESAMGTATSVAGLTVKDGGQSRLSIPAAAKIELPKGTRFARYAMAIAAGKGSLSDTLEFAKRWEDTPDVTTFIRATIGTTTDVSPGWGTELVEPGNLASEFIDLLRPASILGKIEGLRRVPFNVRIPTMVNGSQVNWVGEAAAKPVGNPEFGEATLGFNKIAGIVVMSEELVRLSSPSAEETVRRDLVEQISAFTDSQFLDPAVTATSARPASVTNGVAGNAASGTDGESLRYDLNVAMAVFDTANFSLETMVIVTTPAIARGISTLTNALGQPEFPTVTPRGGTLLGFPVIVSNSAPAGNLVLIEAGEILLADDGAVKLDASNQATIDIAGGNAPALSFWQKNLIGIRAERFITWKKRRAAAVSRITGAAYGPSDTSP